MVSNIVTAQGYKAPPSLPLPIKPSPSNPSVDDTVVDLLTLHDAHVPGESDDKSLQEKNILRDTLLRYMGYANEFTEAGKTSGVGIAKTLNPFAWFTVFAYGISDALNRSMNKHTQILKQTGNEKEAKAYAMSDFGRDVSFHALATWYGPVYIVIKPAAKLTEYLFTKKLNKDPKFWPALAGLATIPFVPKIFDPITEKLLDLVYKPASNYVIQRYLNHSTRPTQ